MFFAFCAGRPTHGERAAIARTRATILIELLFPFPGRRSKKLRPYSLLLTRDNQAIVGAKNRQNYYISGMVYSLLRCSFWDALEPSGAVQCRTYMKPLKIGITGVRGIVGETFTPEVAVGFAQAFATYLDSGRMLVCRDTRSSGPMVRSAVTAGLLAAGCEVIDLGICPTPSLQLAVPWSKADGGIAVTAGHNPAQWNALKFVRDDGLYLNPLQAEELLDIFHQGEFAKAKWNEIEPAIQRHDPIERHIELLRNGFDVGAIGARRLKVAVDCCNGACSRLIPRWLTELGCEVLAINDDPNGAFPHRPEPTPETMAQLSAVVKAGHADIGFAHDADGERLGIVTELGDPLSEELTFALATRIRLEQSAGSIVTNVSTSGAIEQIAARYGGRVVRTQVGQTFISEAMLEHD